MLRRVAFHCVWRLDLATRERYSRTFMPPFQQTPKMPAKPTFVFAGTFTGARGKGKGIYAYWLQTQGLEVSQNITLVPLGLAVETSNPSWIEVDVARRLVFSVNADA